MVKINPFKAVVYNQEKISDISKVVCPPYDVISPQLQDYYHRLSVYNFIYILLGKDSNETDKYESAKNLFCEWQKNGVLMQDNDPAIYFYSQQYNIKGEKRTRFGFIARLHLTQEKCCIYGHEHTRLAPKEDRLRLLRQVKANLSPIFAVFPDRKRVISRIKEKYIAENTPFIEITDDEKTVHKLWRITSPEIIAGIQKNISNENIFIADGHHRYEVACAYREEMKQKLGIITGEEGFNYILAYFTNLDSRGLTILPIHRLVKLDSNPDIEVFKADLGLYFDVEEVKDKDKFFFLLNKAGSTEHVLGMYKDSRYWLLRLKNIRILDKIIEDKPRDYRQLDVSILNYIVLKKILKLDLDDKEAITFTPDSQDLIRNADSDADSIAFFLNPVKVEQIMSIALSGEKMPTKSTYFYPKVLSGLVVNKLE